MEWHNQTITGPGTYYDSHKSKASNLQCDSVYELKVTAQEPSFTQITRTTWSNNPFYFNGRQMSTSGIYYDTLPAAGNKCDSIVELTLTVLDVYDVSYTAEICRGDVYTFNGNELTEPNLYRDTLLSRYFTDSIVNLTLVVHNPRLFTYDRHISDKQSYLWQKHNGDELALTHTGVYDDTIHGGASTGCDSICRLNLYVHQTYDFHEDGATCKGTAYYWRGNPYYEAGEYKDEFLTSGWPVDSIYHTLPSVRTGCDSIVTLELTVKQVYTTNVIDTICRGEKYHINGKELENGGLYIEKFISTVYGTDSTVNLTLVVWEPRIKSSIAHITDQQLPYAWTLHDNSIRMLDHGGVYDDSLQSIVTGCDSINRLQLVVHPTVREEKDTAICAERSYYWHNQTCSATGDYYDTLRNAQWPQLDSIYYELHLTVNDIYRTKDTVYLCEGEHFTFNHKDRSSAGTYYDTLKTTCCGCDSSFILTVKIRNTTTRATAVTICPSELPYTWHTWRDI